METYTTKSGDMWDSIAWAQLGGEQYTDQLINMNLQYRDLFIFPSGIVLTLPEIKPEINKSLPPWKRSGA